MACVAAAALGAALLAGTAGPLPAGGHHAGAGPVRSVVDLIDPSTGPADTRVALVARTETITLSTGESIAAWTWDGVVPGPQITVRQGTLLEVVVRNDDVPDGVTVHWHGIDVPNAMDGVAGVTQQPILPGHSFTYRFRPQRAGTFWYHTHQNSSRGVARGLFGALIVLPPGAPDRPRSSAALDRVLLGHTWSRAAHPDTVAIGREAGTVSSAVAPGTRVRLRLVNTDSLPQHWAITGAEFTLAAIDGSDVHAPTPLRGRTLTLGGGGRYDVAFTMPVTPVVVGMLDGNRPQHVLRPPGPAEAPELTGGPEFDPLGYGSPAPVPFTMGSRYDVEAVQKLETHRVFRRGVPTTWWTINGQRAPDVPMIMVDDGERVRVHLVNASDGIHPMHLHGHRVLVLQRNGVASTGSPWWADTVPLAPGDDVWVAFRADNPGIWMDHCHNLNHAAAGMLMHVGYADVTTPFPARLRTE